MTMGKIMYSAFGMSGKIRELRAGRFIMGWPRRIDIETSGCQAIWEIRSPVFRYADTDSAAAVQQVPLTTFVYADGRLDDTLAPLAGRSVRISGDDGSVWLIDPSRMITGKHPPVDAYVRVVSINEALDLVSAGKIDHRTRVGSARRARRARQERGDGQGGRGHEAGRRVDDGIARPSDASHVQ